MLSTSFTKYLVLLLCCAVLVGCQDSDVRLGREALKVGDYDKALSLFSIAADRNRTDGSVRALIAVTFARKNQIGMAIQFINEARQLGTSGSEIGGLFADAARGLLTVSLPTQALAMFNLAVQQDTSLKKSSAQAITEAAEQAIKVSSPQTAIDLYDAAVKYNPDLASSIAKSVHTFADTRLGTDQSTALMLYRSAVRYDQNVSSEIGEHISKFATAKIDAEPRTALEFMDQAAGYKPALKSKFAKLLTEKALLALRSDNTSLASSLTSTDVRYDPSVARTLAGVALARAKELASDGANWKKIVEFAEYAEPLNVADLAPAWADLLFGAVPRIEVDSALSAGRLMLKFDETKKATLAHMYVQLGQTAIKASDLVQAHTYFDAAFDLDLAARPLVTEAVWDEFNRRLFPPGQLSREAFLELWKMTSRTGYPKAVAGAVAPYVDALKQYLDGSHSQAMSALAIIARNRPESKEGKAAAEILSRPASGTIRYNTQPMLFHAYSFNSDITIRLLSSVITGNEIILEFDLKYIKGKPFLYFIRGDRCTNRLSLVDDNGVRTYSSFGFEGGTEEKGFLFDENNCEHSIKVSPGNEQNVRVRFPMVSPGASKVTFQSPRLDGRHGSWGWNEIPIKKGPFDLVGPTVISKVEQATAPEYKPPKQNPSSGVSSPNSQSRQCFTFNGQQVCN